MVLSFFMSDPLYPNAMGIKEIILKDWLSKLDIADIDILLTGVIMFNPCEH